MNKEALNDILYPHIEPFNSGMLKVSDIHQIYYEQSGNQSGKPVLLIHGGPGAGTNPTQRRYFNPEIYHIILVDQRGCGNSIPRAEIEDNSTQLLVQDFEQLRQLLEINQWLLFGGSWGSTLGLAYAEMHPERITGLILRGIFLGLSEDLRWMYQYGSSEIFPEAWAEFIEIIPENERYNLVAAYRKRLTSVDTKIQQAAAIAWSKWEASISNLLIDNTQIAKFSEPSFSLAFALIENHFFTNNLFLKHNQLIENAYKIAEIPTQIIHGRYDICCPMRGALQLKQALPKATLIIVPNAGHSQTEIGIAKELVDATDKFAR